MGRIAFALVVACLMSGCARPGDRGPQPSEARKTLTQDEPKAGSSTNLDTPRQAKTANDEPNVMPIGPPLAGGITPVQGAEGVQGSPGGVGDAAKGQARHAAGIAGGSSLDQPAEQGN